MEWLVLRLWPRFRGGGNQHPATKELIAGFVALENLKEGEALRLKRKGGMKFPKIGETVYVYRVLPEALADGLDKAHQIRRVDFTTVLETDDGDVLEYSLDSRYFERATV